jgi:hypothetical protein
LICCDCWPGLLLGLCSRETSDLARPTRIKGVGRLFRYFFADEAIATLRFCLIEQLVKLLNHVFKNDFNARSAIKYACAHEDAFGEIRGSFCLASETILNGAESTYGFIGQLQATVCLFQDLELTSFPWICVGRIKVGSSGFLAEGSPLGLA